MFDTIEDWDEPYSEVLAEMDAFADFTIKSEPKLFSGENVNESLWYGLDRDEKFVEDNTERIVTNLSSDNCKEYPHKSEKASESSPAIEPASTGFIFPDSLVHSLLSPTDLPKLELSEYFVDSHQTSEIRNRCCCKSKNVNSTRSVLVKTWKFEETSLAEAANEDLGLVSFSDLMKLLAQSTGGVYMDVMPQMVGCFFYSKLSLRNSIVRQRV